MVQRFGSALNLNVHFHALVLDGVFTKAGPFASPVFFAAPRFEQHDIARLLDTIQSRLLRLLRTRGLLQGPGDVDTGSDTEPDSLLPLLTAASIQGRVALGPEAGKRIERAGEEPAGADRFDSGADMLCANRDGFSLHAEVHVRPGDRVRLEHLCRYVARGPIAAERLSLSPEGKVILDLRRPWRDGTTHFVFDPLTFIERLAAPVPLPGVHLVTYHGVLAPASTWRDMIVPNPPSPVDEPDEALQATHAPGAFDLKGMSESKGAHPSATPCTPGTPGTPGTQSWQVSWTPTSPIGLDGAAPPSLSRNPDRYSWSELMRRVFSIANQESTAAL
ncbi:MAG: hypothetical protein ACI835_005861 [Planctomycetota bacterium]